MRKLIFGMNVTIDGCCDHDKGVPDEFVHNYFAELTRAAGTMLYGRKTYELMVPFWPEIAKSKEPQPDNMKTFADAFVSVPQLVVVSKTLKKVDDQKTAIIHSNLIDEVLKMKKQSGGPILTGGVDIPSQLMQAGLVDEIHLVVQPVVAGRGRRLFNEMNLPDQLAFQLLESKTFKSGCIALHYGKN